MSLFIPGECGLVGVGGCMEATEAQAWSESLSNECLAFSFSWSLCIISLHFHQPSNIRGRMSWFPWSLLTLLLVAEKIPWKSRCHVEQQNGNSELYLWAGEEECFGVELEGRGERQWLPPFTLHCHKDTGATVGNPVQHPLSNWKQRGEMMWITGENASQLLCFSIQGDANIHGVVYRLPRAQPGYRCSIERRPVGEVLVVEDQGFTQQRPQVKLGHLEGHAFGGLLIATVGHCCPGRGTCYIIKNQNKRNSTLPMTYYPILRKGSLQIVSRDWFCDPGSSSSTPPHPWLASLSGVSDEWSLVDSEWPHGWLWHTPTF